MAPPVIIRHAVPPMRAPVSTQAADVAARMRQSFEVVRYTLYTLKGIEILTNADGSRSESEVRNKWLDIIHELLRTSPGFGARVEFYGKSPVKLWKMTVDQVGLQHLGDDGALVSEVASNFRVDIMIWFRTMLQIGDKTVAHFEVPNVVVEVKPINNEEKGQSGLGQLFWYLYLAHRVYKSACGIYIAGNCFWVFTVDRDGELWHHHTGDKIESLHLLDYAVQAGKAISRMQELPAEDGDIAVERLEELVKFLAPQVEYAANLEQVPPTDYGRIHQTQAPVFSGSAATKIANLALDQTTDQGLRIQAREIRNVSSLARIRTWKWAIKRWHANCVESECDVEAPFRTDWSRCLDADDGTDYSGEETVPSVDSEYCKAVLRAIPTYQSQ